MAAAGLPELPAPSPARSRAAFACERLDDAVRVGRAVCGWALGLPGRLLGKDAASLAVDTLVFAVGDLPPVLYGRAVDLPLALLRLRPEKGLLRDPAGAAALAARTSLDVLGGGFVKLAQVIAHSPALFPQGLVRACRGSLANAVTPPASFPELAKEVTKELGVTSLSDLFLAFEQQPLASASIAQVHAATLRSGERCVVKVVRPHARERLAVDFGALLLLARLADLVLGEELVLQFLSAPLEACVDELRRAVMDECDLDLERRNMEAFRVWLESSRPLRRAGLHGSVRVPRTFPHASGGRVLTMERIEGLPLSELCAHGRSGDMAWQGPLVRALTVAALSVVDDATLFHADLHSGNMIVRRSPLGEAEQIAFIDFGCCGRVPAALRSALLMQASAFASGRPDVKQFTRGFAHALERMPGLGDGELDIDALAADLKPLLLELKRINPFRPGADPLKETELHSLLFRLQWALHRHGVQLPREFTLLLKTGCFGALYFSLLDASHRALLSQNLALAGAAYASCHLREARVLLSPATLAKLLQLLKDNDRTALAIAVAPQCRYAVALCAAAGVPLVWLALQQLAGPGPA